MKVVCVPKTKEALQRLDFDECIDGDLNTIIIHDDSLQKLFEVGFFTEINSLTNSNIDDFEDDTVVDAALLNKVLNSGIFEKYQQFPDVASIRKLFIEACRCGTGVFFYF